MYSGECGLGTDTVSDGYQTGAVPESLCCPARSETSVLLARSGGLTAM